MKIFAISVLICLIHSGSLKKKKPSGHGKPSPQARPDERTQTPEQPQHTDEPVRPTQPSAASETGRQPPVHSEPQAPRLNPSFPNYPVPNATALPTTHSEDDTLEVFSAWALKEGDPSMRLVAVLSFKATQHDPEGVYTVDVGLNSKKLKRRKPENSTIMAKTTIQEVLKIGTKVKTRGYHQNVELYGKEGKISGVEIYRKNSKKQNDPNSHPEYEIMYTVDLDDKNDKKSFSILNTNLKPMLNEVPLPNQRKEFGVGDRVRIYGLTNEKHKFLNGGEGQIETELRNGRHQVRLENIRLDKNSVKRS